jgi:cytochrome c2
MYFLDQRPKPAAQLDEDPMKKSLFLNVFGVITAGALSIAAPAMAAGDAEAGKVVFKKCLTCHSDVAGQNKIGPSLYGLIGRPSASVDKYSYSAAMKNFNKTWDEATLFDYLAAPMKAVPGTKMSFVGLPDEKDRRNVIAYLTTLK